ncbi:Amino-acid permease BAT1 [Linum perenne]
MEDILLIAFIDIISIWWQVIGGLVIVILLPLVATTTQSASYVFTHFEVGSGTTGVSSMPYAVILSFLVSQYSLYGYDTAAHLTEETKAQILYDAFHGRYQNSAGAIILLFVIWGSFFFGGLSITTSAARVVYALSRDKGLPFSSVWSKIHPKHKVPSNAVWLCAAICILLGLPILKVNVVFTAITSICTIGWVGGYAVPIFARMVMDEKKFKIWICYTCCVFLLPTMYPITWDTFNYAPVALGIGLGLIMLWWVLDARKWFKGPVRNIDAPNGHKV